MFPFIKEITSDGNEMTTTLLEIEEISYFTKYFPVFHGYTSLLCLCKEILWINLIFQEPEHSQKRKDGKPFTSSIDSFFFFGLIASNKHSKVYNKKRKKHDQMTLLVYNIC